MNISNFLLIIVASISISISVGAAEENDIRISAKEVRIVDSEKFNFDKCAYVAQEICTSKRGYSACFNWHKKKAAKNKADTVSIFSQNKSFNAFSLTGTKASVVADYYNCRHR